MQLTDRLTKDNATLRAREEVNRSLMDAISDCVMELDLDGRVLHMNAPGLRAMETDDVGPLRGQQWLAWWPAQAQGDIARSVTAAAGGEVSTFEAICPSFKGTLKCWSVTVSPVSDAGRAQVVRLLAVCSDVTERRAAAEKRRASEDSLRLSEARLNRLHQTISDPKLQAAERLQRLLRLGIEEFGLENGVIAEIADGLYRIALAETPDGSVPVGFTCDARDVICTETLRRNDLLAIESLAQTDWRSHRSYSGFGTEIYFGVPLPVAGSIFGTLCYTSRTARSRGFSTGDHEFLRLLAQTIGTEMTRQHIAGQLSRAEERQRSAMQAANAGWWEWDIGTGAIVWSEENYAFYDLDPALGAPSYAGCEARVHTDDRAPANEIVRSALEGHATDFRSEYRVVHRDGRVVWLLKIGRVERNAHGTAIRLSGMTVDITTRKLVEEAEKKVRERLRRALTAARMVTWELDPATDTLVLSDNAPDVFGIPPATLLPKSDLGLALVHPDDVKRHRATLLAAIAACGSFVSRFRIIRQDNGAVVWVEDRGHGVRGPDGAVRLTGVTLDVTARHEAEQKLRIAHDTFRHLVDHSPFGIYVVDADLRIVQVSDGGQKTFANVRPLIGRDLSEALRILWPEPFCSDATAIIRRTLETGESHHAARRMEVRADIGVVEAYDWKVERISMPDGRPGVVCHFYDLSERLHFEALLRKSEERYRDLFDSLMEGYCLIEMIYDDGGRAIDYRFLEMNPAFESQTGLKDAKGRTIRELTPEIEASWIEMFAKVAETGESVRFDAGVAALSRRFDVQGFRVDHDGSNKVAIVFNDITERTATEKALQESDERYRAASSAVSDVVWTNNADGLMVGEQRGWAHFTGQSREEYKGYGWSNAVHPEDAQPTIDAWSRAVAEKRRFVFEHRIRRRDGEWRLCSIRAVPILNVDRTIREWVGVHADITDRKRDEERLRSLAAELSESSHRKDEFIATLAHELRNPLAPIRNGLQLIKMAAGQPATIEQARSMMERQLTQMVRLVDDLMDVSRINLGKLELRKERLPLSTVLNSALETSRPLIEQMGHALTVAIPDQALIVDADMTRLAQAFLNLLNNAAKYSDPGGHIRVNVDVQGGEVVVAVTDTGIGMDADHLSRIFGMFTQIGGALDRAQGGLGIGLTLVKRLVDLHGGTVVAKSDGLGMGSEFVVRLPRVLESPEPDVPGAGDEPIVARSSLRVLIVDDNRDGADSLSEMLKVMGNDTRTAYDGQQGVNTAREYRPDVVLLDIGLPKLNGYEACRLIREEPDGKGIVMIAVTGWGQDEDRRRSNEAGFDHHLVKPVDPQALLSLIATLDSARDARR